MANDDKFNEFNKNNSASGNNSANNSGGNKKPGATESFADFLARQRSSSTQPGQQQGQQTGQQPNQTGGISHSSTGYTDGSNFKGYGAQNVPPVTEIPKFKTPQQLKEEIKQRKLEEKLKKIDSKNSKTQQPKQQRPASEKQQQTASTSTTEEEIRLLEELRNLENAEKTGVLPSSMATNAMSVTAGEFFKKLEDMNRLSGTSGVTKENVEAIKDRKQEILDQLEKLRSGQYRVSEDRRRKKGGFLWIILALILLIGAGVGYMLLRPKDNDDDKLIKTPEIQLKIDFNEESESLIRNEDGNWKIPVDVVPGTTINDINLFIINKHEQPNTIGPDYYLRFRIYITIDGEKITDKNYLEFEPTSNRWVQSAGKNNSDFFYLKGKLKSNEEVSILSEIKFSWENIGNEFVGKTANIIIEVDANDSVERINAEWRSDAGNIFIEIV